MSFTGSKVPLQRAHLLAFSRGTLTVLRHFRRPELLVLLVTHTERPQPRSFNLELAEAVQLVELLKGEGYGATEFTADGEASTARHLSLKAGGLIMGCTFEKMPGWKMLGFGCAGAEAPAMFDMSPRSAELFATCVAAVITEGAARA